ncbi:bacteriocin [Priestia taiwanensis]|uniref:Bacteriocin n=1 Tax=Priestia taiwanensis TaxID=1347902 RepID=A0A917ES20_9BACI|nr:bacteriocin [Priestia taiwanensis]MBM7365299.1 bacteriocin-like protein [Priestia taiwanensis]GGE85990.1 hypothetical protein GCM10007140_39210 [Priestia taiwanensis]
MKNLTALNEKELQEINGGSGWKWVAKTAAKATPVGRAVVTVGQIGYAGTNIVKGFKKGWNEN